MEQKEQNFEMKEKILAGCNGIPLKNLVNFLLDGVVTQEELAANGLLPEKLAQIEQLLAEQEELLWTEAVKANTVAGYRKYLSCYPNGVHSKEAEGTLLSIEEAFWGAISASPTKEGLEEYEKTFPEGSHVEECRGLLEDLP